VSAESEAQVLMVDRVALLAVIQANPEIALKMMAVFNQRLQQLHEMVHGLVSERALVRLARFIQYSAGEPGTKSVGKEPVCAYNFPIMKLLVALALPMRNACVCLSNCILLLHTVGVEKLPYSTGMG
jgi:CRP-like cAMP-binding protein